MAFGIYFVVSRRQKNLSKIDIKKLCRFWGQLTSLRIHILGSQTIMFAFATAIDGAYTHRPLAIVPLPELRLSLSPFGKNITQDRPRRAPQGNKHRSQNRSQELLRSKGKG
jgi:hypothetical protein